MATSYRERNIPPIVIISDDSDEEIIPPSRPSRRNTSRQSTDKLDSVLVSNNSRRSTRPKPPTSYGESPVRTPVKRSYRDDIPGPSNRSTSRTPRKRVARHDSTGSYPSSGFSRGSTTPSPRKQGRHATVDSQKSNASAMSDGRRPGRKRKAARINTEVPTERAPMPKPKKQKESESEATGDAVCILCRRSGSDRNLYFRMEKLPVANGPDIFAHYLCMFTASNLSQTEDPRDKVPGTVCGFSVREVEQERDRARSLRCKYCNKYGAPVGCAVAKCKMTYHYPCGVEKGCFFSFMGSFESFCPEHIKFERFRRPKDLSQVNRECVVCLEEPDLKDRMNSLVTTCCHRAMHRNCLVPCAVNAGKHHIKCPACNDVDEFRTFCNNVGIHVPNADATWLAEEIAAEEAEDQRLEAEAAKCAAGPNCTCPNGLTHDQNLAGADWNLEFCAGGCGTLMHAECMQHKGIKGRNRQNFCKGCYELDCKVDRQMGRREHAVPEDSPEIPERMPARVRRHGSRRS